VAIEETSNSLTLYGNLHQYLKYDKDGNGMISAAEALEMPDRDLADMLNKASFSLLHPDNSLTNGYRTFFTSLPAGKISSLFLQRRLQPQFFRVLFEEDQVLGYTVVCNVLLSGDHNSYEVADSLAFSALSTCGSRNELFTAIRNAAPYYTMLREKMPRYNNAISGCLRRKREDIIEFIGVRRFSPYRKDTALNFGNVESFQKGVNQAELVFAIFQRGKQAQELAKSALTVMAAAKMRYGEDRIGILIVDYDGNVPLFERFKIGNDFSVMVFQHGHRVKRIDDLDIQELVRLIKFYFINYYDI
jgi:hypothetical protein